MSRFFIDAAQVGEGTLAITSKEDIHHITKVLRLKAGDRIDVSDGAEWEYETEIISLDADCVEARITDKQKFAREPKTLVTLFQGIPKQGKMETIVQKTVELGVYEIVPVFTERTVVTDKGNFTKKIERWQKVSDEAVKQCKRGIIPQIVGDVRFKEMLNMLVNYDLTIFPYENEEQLTIKQCLRGLTCMPQTVAIIIGPEGGFSGREADEIKAAGAACVTLGRTILRTETAGMAALAMTMYELEL